MAQPRESEYFFETDAVRAKRTQRDAKSSNTFGSPINLTSKLLAAVPDPRKPGIVFVAAAAGKVFRINTGTGEREFTYTGPQAPLPCIAIDVSRNAILAGCWDKGIYEWDIETGRLSREQPLQGHTDFVKSLVTGRLEKTPVIISGGADGKIIVWNAESGKPLYTLKDEVTRESMGSIQHLVLDPVSSSLSEDDLTAATKSLNLVSSSSDTYTRRWKLTLDGYDQVPFDDAVKSGDVSEDSQNSASRRIHTSTVYRLFFDESSDADLWSASSDGTAKCLSRAQNFAEQETLEHGDHVRAVVATEQWTITAGRDENIKVWDRSSGKLHSTLIGHFDEITDLSLLPASSSATVWKVCSVSLDGTLRVWPLERNELSRIVEEMQTKDRKEESEAKPQPAENLLTEEEEAELAALMEDD